MILCRWTVNSSYNLQACDRRHRRRYVCLFQCRCVWCCLLDAFRQLRMIGKYTKETKTMKAYYNSDRCIAATGRSLVRTDQRL